MDRSAGSIWPPLKLLLFDLDDTLCDYAGARARRLRLAFSVDLGQQPVGSTSVPTRDLDRMIADSLAMHPHGADHFAELFRRHGIGEPGVAEAAADWYRTNRFHGLGLFGDAASSIAALRRRTRDMAAGTSRGIGVVTNGPADVQRAKVDLLGVGDLVDFVVVSEEFGAWKPDRRIFEEALRLGRASASEAVFIGDSAEHDMAGAREAGIRSIWVNRSGEPWTDERFGPDHEVANLAALLPLLGVAD